MTEELRVADLTDEVLELRLCEAVARSHDQSLPIWDRSLLLSGTFLELLSEYWRRDLHEVEEEVLQAVWRSLRRPVHQSIKISGFPIYGKMFRDPEFDFGSVFDLEGCRDLVVRILQASVPSARRSGLTRLKGSFRSCLDHLTPRKREATSKWLETVFDRWKYQELSTTPTGLDEVVPWLTSQAFRDAWFPSVVGESTTRSRRIKRLGTDLDFIESSEARLSDIKGLWRSWTRPLTHFKISWHPFGLPFSLAEFAQVVTVEGIDDKLAEEIHEVAMWYATPWNSPLFCQWETPTLIREMQNIALLAFWTHGKTKSTFLKMKTTSVRLQLDSCGYALIESWARQVRKSAEYEGEPLPMLSGLAQNENRFRATLAELLRESILSTETSTKTRSDGSYDTIQGSADTKPVLTDAVADTMRNGGVHLDPRAVRTESLPSAAPAFVDDSGMRWYSAAHVAALIGVHVNTIHRWRRRGKAGATKFLVQGVMFEEPPSGEKFVTRVYSEEQVHRLRFRADLTSVDASTLARQLGISVRALRKRVGTIRKSDGEGNRRMDILEVRMLLLNDASLNRKQGVEP